MSCGAILDIDGTLVDTNYQHALAWFRAFCEHDIVLPVFRIHRHIGMGGDQLVTALAGEQVEREQGDAIRSAEQRHYESMIGEVQLMAGARELIGTLKERGSAVVLASSARPEEVAHYRKLLDLDDLIDAATSSGDVDATKPHPDLIEAARAKVGADRAVMVGDSTWDCEAANRAGIETVGLLTGGFSEQELRNAGAAFVTSGLPELIERFEASPLAAVAPA